MHPLAPASAGDLDRLITRVACVLSLTLALPCLWRKTVKCRCVTTAGRGHAADDPRCQGAWCGGFICRGGALFTETDPSPLSTQLGLGICPKLSAFLIAIDLLSYGASGPHGTRVQRVHLRLLDWICKLLVTIRLSPTGNPNAIIYLLSSLTMFLGYLKISMIFFNFNH
jgi:hypothetical protein